MPIPLGILAAAGVRPTAGGSYELIETITVSGSSTSSITFSNLNTYNTTYQHLQIRATMRTIVQSALVYVAFNGDSGSNYSYHSLTGNGSSVSSGAGTNATRLELYMSAASTEAGSYFAPMVADILDPYETSKNKTWRALSGRPGNLFPQIELNSGLWRNTNALTSVTMTAAGTNWASGSRFSIYGLKAS